MVKIATHETSAKEDALLSAIDESFTALCSVSVRDSFYEFLDKEFNLKRNEIPSKLDSFVEALEKATGPAPSRVIMKNVLRRFCAKLGVEFDSKHFGRQSFPDWVKALVGSG